MSINKALRKRSGIPNGIANSNKTHCPQGHPYSKENTSYITRPGSRSGSVYTTRVCKACKRARAQDRYWSKTKEKHPGSPGRPPKND